MRCSKLEIVSGFHWRVRIAMLFSWYNLQWCASVFVCIYYVKFSDDGRSMRNFIHHSKWNEQTERIKWNFSGWRTITTTTTELWTHNIFLSLLLLFAIAFQLFCEIWFMLECRACSQTHWSRMHRSNAIYELLSISTYISHTNPNQSTVIYFYFTCASDMHSIYTTAEHFMMVATFFSWF